MSQVTAEMRFEETGEERPPRRGEWYMGMLGAPALAPRDFYIRHLPILRRVDDGPREELEIERERLDAEAKDPALVPLVRVDPGEPWPPPPPQPTRLSKPNDLRPIGEAAPAVRRSYLPYTDDLEDS